MIFTIDIQESERQLIALVDADGHQLKFISAQWEDLPEEQQKTFRRRVMDNFYQELLRCIRDRQFHKDTMQFSYDAPSGTARIAGYPDEPIPPP